MAPRTIFSSVACCVPLMMVAQWLLECYYNYALLMGVTSYRSASGGFRQTWLTRAYALAANVFTLLGLPWAFWNWSQYIETIRWFPNLINATVYILYTVNYVSITYTLISRGSRDKALLEVNRIVTRLKHQRAHEVADLGLGLLNCLYVLKLGTVVFLALNSAISCLMMPNEHKFFFILYGFFYSNAMNITQIAIYRYFLALWDIAYCYRYVNAQLTQLIGCVHQRYPTNVELRQLHRLWSLHSLLGRCTLRVNGIHGYAMLAARFDNMAFSVVNGYWGIVFSFGASTPLYVVLYGAANYNVRFLDFYLVNFMCDLTVEYQSAAHHALTEGYWFRELNAYLLYARSSKLSLWICGLYKVNRSCWFRIMASILGYTVLLLQFHLHLNKKYTL